MSIFGITKCCFCCDHLKGVNVLGWVYLAFAVVILTLNVIQLNIVAIVVGAVSILIIAQLIHGTNTKNKKKLLPFVVLMFIGAALRIAYIVWVAISVTDQIETMELALLIGCGIDGKLMRLYKFIIQSSTIHFCSFSCS